MNTIKCCTYCSSIEKLGRDHVIPSSYSQDHKHFENDCWVWCCYECNALLGAKLLPMIQLRAEYLLERYQRKYKSALSMPDWTKTELKTMGKTIRRDIEATLKQKAIIKRRLYCLKLVASANC